MFIEVPCRNLTSKMNHNSFQTVYAVQCYNYTVNECSESGVRESVLCMELAKSNKRNTQECHYSQDSCFQIAGELKGKRVAQSSKLENRLQLKYK